MPYNSGYRGGVFIGIGSGLGYGYGSGLGYGNLGYGYGGYGYSGGYGYRNYGYNSLGIPAIPGAYIAPSYSVVPSQPLDPQPLDPQPLPLPVTNATGEAAPATITVIASDGAKVTFDGIDTNQTGTRHSFTTRPIDPGAEKRVSVKVDGPGGPATISIGVRAGEKATVDMRK
ncbi:MAG TPA: TIGR03000 domain-containing protein [Gemmata sp.]